MTAFRIITGILLLLFFLTNILMSLLKIKLDTVLWKIETSLAIVLALLCTCCILSDNAEKLEIRNECQEKFANYEATTYEYTSESISIPRPQSLSFCAIIQDIGIIGRRTADSKKLPVFLDCESKNELGGIYSNGASYVVLVQNQVTAMIDHSSIIVDGECVANVEPRDVIVGEGDIPWAMWEYGKITITSECKLDVITAFLILAKDNL